MRFGDFLIDKNSPFIGLMRHCYPPRCPPGVRRKVAYQLVWQLCPSVDPLAGHACARDHESLTHITSLAGLVRQEIEVNGTDSIGTLLTGALLQENGTPPTSVDFVTDSSGFPAMPRQLQSGDWGAAFLAEPYVTIAEETYGDRVLVDLDQGAMQNFPID